MLRKLQTFLGSTREKALAEIIDGFNCHVQIEFVEKQFVTLLHQCLSCIKRGSIREIALASCFIGLLALTVGSGQNGNVIFEESPPPLSQALKSGMDASNLAMVVAVGLPSPSLIATLVTAWTFILTSIDRTSCDPKQWLKEKARKGKFKEQCFQPSVGKRRVRRSKRGRSEEGVCEVLRFNEDDMELARSLMMLANGNKEEKDDELKVSVDVPPCTVALTESTKVNGGQCYKCSVCGKELGSYQSLGGHKASHRKSVASREDTTVVDVEKVERSSVWGTQALPLRRPTRKTS